MPAEEIYKGLVELGFDIISVKQMSTLFLIILSLSEKSHEIFKLTSLCCIAIKVEPYKSQTGLTQCHNCQQFGHVWANCKQPPHCLWCGGRHLHRECPEKGKEDSTPACCDCKLAEGEKHHPSNYRGCSHAKEEMRQRKIPRAPKPNTGRAFSSKYIMPGVSFAEALQSKADQTQQNHPRQAAVVAKSSDSTETAGSRSVNTGSNCKQFASGQHGQGSNCSTEIHDRVQ
jgi:hypothetical protein